MPRLVPIFAALLALAHVAHAQTPAYCPASPPQCDDTTTLCGSVPCIQNPIYVSAADTQVPVLHRLGKKLRGQVDNTGTPTPITIVYVPNGSCTNLANMYATPTKFPVGTAGGPFFIPADTTFDVTAKTACPCSLPAPNTLQSDMGITIVNPDNVSCPTNPANPPAGLKVTKGPVQGMTFVVPFDSGTMAGSSQKAITAEEAYLVLGLGANGSQVPPWSDINYIYGRPSSKGTQISIGANIKVPAAKWKLVQDTNHLIDQSSTMASTIAGLTGDPNAEKVLGILGTEIYDKNRAKIHALAFRAFNQLHAYWPDSKLSTFDKQNIRDGHYVLWSYVQYVAPTTPKPEVQLIIDSLTGAATDVKYNNGTANVDADPMDDVIASGLVPICGMKVQRQAQEGGDLSPYQPTAPCGCYFDSKATGASSCTPCTSTCSGAGQVCRRGFCEAQ
jgi:hypothetical protein